MDGADGLAPHYSSFIVSKSDLAPILNTVPSLVPNTCLGGFLGPKRGLSPLSDTGQKKLAITS
eukprot:scaffold23234_cov104-Skeletonema_marinoi.AAC.2